MMRTTYFFSVPPKSNSTKFDRTRVGGGDMVKNETEPSNPPYMMLTTVFISHLFLHPLQWQRYLACDPLPELEDEAGINTFLTMWEMEKDWSDVDTLLEGIRVAEEVSGPPSCVWVGGWMDECGYTPTLCGCGPVQFGYASVQCTSVWSCMVWVWSYSALVWSCTVWV